MIIAGSILLGRALAPIDQLFGSWRSLDTARDAYRRLRELLSTYLPQAERMALPQIRGEYQLDKLVVTPSAERYECANVAQHCRPRRGPN